MCRGLHLFAVFVAALSAVPAPAGDARELAVVAAAHDSPTEGSIGPIRLDKPGGVVIRSAEELVAHSARPGSAKDVAVQKETTAALAKLLDVDAIDWKTHMVVAVRVEPGTKADRARFDSLRIEGKVLTVAWSVRPRPPHAGPGTPTAVALVERFDGDVKVVP